MVVNSLVVVDDDRVMVGNRQYIWMGAGGGGIKGSVEHIATAILQFV